MLLHTPVVGACSGINQPFCSIQEESRGRGEQDSHYDIHTIDFSFQPLLHDWCNKGHGMCYPVCGMMHIIKEPLLLIERVAHVAAVGFFSRYLSGPLPYV